MSKRTTTTTQGNMIDEQEILGAFNIGDFKPVEGKIITPTPETITPVPAVSPKKAPKFVFNADEVFGGEEEEKFTLNDLQKAMKDVLQANSKAMARARVFITGEDENGLPFGNFNGAGNRAITMYQPDHPEAGTGRNYGKVFYRWSNPKVVDLMNAIFEECGWDPAELLEENEQVGEVQEE